VKYEGGKEGDKGTEGGKMAQFYQIETRPKSWLWHGELGKKDKKLDRHTNTQSKTQHTHTCKKIAYTKNALSHKERASLCNLGRSCCPAYINSLYGFFILLPVKRGFEIKLRVKGICRCVSVCVCVRACVHVWVEERRSAQGADAGFPRRS